MRGQVGRADDDDLEALRSGLVAPANLPISTVKVRRPVISSSYDHVVDELAGDRINAEPDRGCMHRGTHDALCLPAGDRVLDPRSQERLPFDL